MSESRNESNRSRRPSAHKRRHPDSSGERDSGEESPPAGEALLSLPSAIVSWTQHWIAIDKPAGLPSRPAPGHPASALGLLEEWLRRSAPESGRPGVVHRLDLSTSGVLLFSLGPAAHRALRQAWVERSVRKEYSALVIGWPQPRRGLISIRLRRNPSGKMVPDGRGMEASTRYDTLRRYAAASWLRIQPLTGRMHQIRVHLAARGTPILGDRRYGPRELPPAIPAPPRLCLHAERLVLPASLVLSLEPVERAAAGDRRDAGERWSISAPEPELLARYRERLAGGNPPELR